MISLFLLVLPLICSIFLLLNKGEAIKKYAFFMSLLPLIPTGIILFQFNQQGATQFIFETYWIKSLGISFKIGIDGISLLLVMLTNILLPLIVMSSIQKQYENQNIFYSLIFFMQMSLIGVFISLDGFLFYIFWELALIPIYFICLIWGGENRSKITLKFFIYTLAGSLLMLVALIYIYLHTPGSHSFSINELYDAARKLPASSQSYLFWALFAAFAIKMPVFPFHTWQPDTYTNAPVQGTMLLSGIMLKMGIYGVIRWLLPMLPAGVMIWRDVAIILSVIGVVYASCIAMVQKDFKRLIAFSSIAHVGLISAGVFSSNIQGLQGAMIQMFSHGILVFALFYLIDLIEIRTKTRILSELGGIRSIAPKFATTFMIVMMGSIALPFTNGFVGEFLLINGIYQFNPTIAAFAGLTVILGAIYMLSAYQKSMLGEINESTGRFTEITKQEMMVILPIIGLVIFFGIYPKPLLSITEYSITNLTNFFK